MCQYELKLETQVSIGAQTLLYANGDNYIKISVKRLVWGGGNSVLRTSIQFFLKWLKQSFKNFLHYDAFSNTYVIAKVAC